MIKRIARAMVSIFLGAALLGGGGAAQEECVVCRRLEQEGFPKSYQTALCALQIARPSWRFEALPITALSREKGKNYDFSTVVEEEWRVAGRSLVSAGKEYGTYAQTGSRLYDSGFYQANREAVRILWTRETFFPRRGSFSFYS